MLYEVITHARSLVATLGRFLSIAGNLDSIAVSHALRTDVDFPHDKSRITSYNVCYTKLLRSSACLLVLVAASGLRKLCARLVRHARIIPHMTPARIRGSPDKSRPVEIFPTAQFPGRLLGVSGGTGRPQALNASALAPRVPAEQADRHPDAAEAGDVRRRQRFVITSYSIHYTKLYEFSSG